MAAAAKSAFSRGEYEEAVTLLSSVLSSLLSGIRDVTSRSRLKRMRRDLATISCNRSAALLRLGRGLNALSDAQLAVDQVPDWATAHWRMGCALSELHRYEEAAQAFERARSCAEDSPERAQTAAQGERQRRRRSITLPSGVSTDVAANAVAEMLRLAGEQAGGEDGLKEAGEGSEDLAGPRLAWGGQTTPDGEH